ncbi:CLUMA_CG020293, isoform A [Clunio marinus]|uniref:CLUMA_CG020293, isoform A n=1 Tax=Clunio marinus TaxID=568069 RepID=A0A1J1J5P6_9DIPT|nr:CLUMA_CG020293, isoform A [Clunio marinus]
MSLDENFINFLDLKLSDNCEIQTDGVSDDFYDLKNLISNDIDKRRIGFMAFHVSRPPISITITFKWKINLKVIKVYSVLSSLRSTQFQVFVQCRNYSGEEIFRKIGDVSLNDDHDGFYLKTEDVKSTKDGNLKFETIFPYARQSIKSINVIKIVIQNTKLKRAPVLRKLEIWGIPSFKNSRSDIQLIRSLWNHQEPSQSSLTRRAVPLQNDATMKIEQIEQFDIPGEFLDSITHELLTMPFVLPSGNIIDESTIEKHNRNECSYGRLPSDPFTGVIYTAKSQPIFNASLKARLDLFKMQNSYEKEVKNSGRTIGTNRETAQANSSCYSSGHIGKKIKFDNSSSSDINSIISSIYKNKQISIFTQTTKEVADHFACFKCTLSSSTNLYQISSCGHIFCKPCLLQLNSICCACQTSFQTKDVLKKNL